MSKKSAMIMVDMDILKIYIINVAYSYICHIKVKKCKNIYSYGKPKKND